jgi:hypothetical protein
MSDKYLHREDLNVLTATNEYTIDSLTSTDSIDEKLLLQKLKGFSLEDQKIIQLIALQFGVIGFGNKNFGEIKINDKKYLIQDLLKKYHIVHGSKINEKYNPDQLTVRRIMRLYRYQVQNFIIKNQRPSYLYFKYSDKNPKYLHVCFPMAEHLVENKDEALYLYKTYKTLDTILQTRFCERVFRVLVSRGLMKLEDISKI